MEGDPVAVGRVVDVGALTPLRRIAHEEEPHDHRVETTTLEGDILGRRGWWQVARRAAPPARTAAPRLQAVRR